MIEQNTTGLNRSGIAGVDQLNEIGMESFQNPTTNGGLNDDNNSWFGGDSSMLSETLYNDTGMV